MRLDKMFKQTGSPFCYYPGLVSRFNITVTSSIFLCYVAWKIFEDEDEWMAFSLDQIERATGLTPDMQRNARKQLVSRGLLVERYARLEHTLMFKICSEEVAENCPEIANGQDGHIAKGNLGNLAKAISSKVLKTKKEKKGDLEKPETQKPFTLQDSHSGSPPPIASPPSPRKTELLKIEIPDSLKSSPKFLKLWDEWLLDRKERKVPVTERAAKLQLQDLEAWGVESACTSLRNSISNNWRGLFKPKKEGGNGKPNWTERKFDYGNENF